MEKIILYYKFLPVTDPHIVMLWQRELCTRLQLRGRIIISTHGINGTLGGSLASLRTYKSEMNKSVAFKGITYKWSDGSAQDFPRLSVKVREEIVTFGASQELKVDDNGVINGGTHLKPRDVHELIKKRGDEVIFFDGRNKYESSVGRFKNAITPDVETTRDFITEIEKPKYNAIKDKPIVTYCTGGIRCEVMSALMKNRGFQEVYQIEGGIASYGKEYADSDLWEGKLYVFDERMTLSFSDASKDIGSCVHCHTATSHYENCANMQCNKLVLVCEACLKKQKYYCEYCALTPAETIV
ncbi:MAG: rhodanese-related sulfurtransferase [Candidatus Saccharimonadales bacterium]